MLPQGTESDYAEDRTDSRTVKISPDSKKKDGHKKSVNAHIQDSGVVSIFFQKVRPALSAFFEQFPIGRNRIISTQNEGDEDQSQEEGEKAEEAEGSVRAVPKQTGFDFCAEGLHQRGYNNGDNPAGKTDIVEGISHMRVLCVQGNGDQNIADNDSDSNGKQQLTEKGEVLHQDNLRNDRREGGSVKADIEILLNRNTMYLGIEDIAHEDGPDI